MRNERLFIENHEYKRESKQTLVEVLYARIWLRGGEGDVKKDVVTGADLRMGHMGPGPGPHDR